MSITTRIAQPVEQIVQNVTEIVQAGGVPGLQGPPGPAGEDGEDGVDATGKPPVYKTATTDNLTLSANQGNQFRVLLDNDGDVELHFTGFLDGAKLSVALTQNAAGAQTVTWPANIKWAGGAVPVLTATPNKRDVFGFERWKHGAENGYDGFVIGLNI